MQRFLLAFLIVLVSNGICFGGEILRDTVTYDKTSGVKLDVYYEKGRKAPGVILFYHGGAWKMGSKDRYIYLGKSLAKDGFVVVIPNL